MINKGSGQSSRRKFRRQASDSWTDAATLVRAIREEKETEETVRKMKIKVREKAEKL